MDNKIVIRKMNKFYGRKQALFDIDLTIEQGMFGLLGRNGAGKTTLMKTIAALHPMKSGEVTVCGVPSHEIEIVCATRFLIAKKICSHTAVNDKRHDIKCLRIGNINGLGTVVYS